MDQHGFAAACSISAAVRWTISRLYSLRRMGREIVDSGHFRRFTAAECCAHD
jgi:hypothetical protein